MTAYDDLAALDPATLTPTQRGRLRALARTAANPETRKLATRILSADPTAAPEALRRGAARAEGYRFPGIQYER